MQQGLIQALMTVLPNAASSVPSQVLQGDGTVDFASFLQSMAPALEQQLEGMPTDVRASLLAELGQEIRNAQAVADVTGPDAQALDAMLASSTVPAQGDEPSSSSVLEQLLAMLGEVAPAAPGEASEGAEEAQTLLVSEESQAADAMPLLAGMAAAPVMGALKPAQGGAMMDAVTSRGGGQRQLDSMLPTASQDGSASDQHGRRAVDQAARDAFMPMMAPVPSRDAMQPPGAAALLARETAQAALKSEGASVEALVDASDKSPLGPIMAEAPRLRAGHDLAVLDRISVPPHQTRDFGEAMGQRVMLMVGREMQGARIELNPVDLGPMEIHLQLRGNEATVHFGAAHALTREAIEAAIPRLRDLLAEQGFTQVNVNVGQQGQNAQTAGGQGNMSGQGSSAFGRASGHEQGDGQAAQAQTVEMRIRASGVDLFV
ncbi:MAG: hypothetical protein FNT29_00595 [Halothiobacillaceae bacterium]|jgi:flagellar hook-length control protein FliK|nr:MAG: hypothetical protein FNT29_00595 [Halothiobacillaceae bacterium]